MGSSLFLKTATWFWHSSAATWLCPPWRHASASVVHSLVATLPVLPSPATTLPGLRQQLPLAEHQGHAEHQAARPAGRLQARGGVQAPLGRRSPWPHLSVPSS